MQETLGTSGHQVIFYPVFHYELNFIENFWGGAKLYIRANCQYTFPFLIRTVLVVLAQISNQLIWKYYQRILHMMDTYRNDLVYGLAEFKKYGYTRYSSHQQIAESEIHVN